MLREITSLLPVSSNSICGSLREIPFVLTTEQLSNLLVNDTNDPVMLSSTPPVDGSRSPGKSGLSLGGLMRSTSRSQPGGYSKYTPSPAAANGESAEYFTAKPIGETDGTISPGAGGLNGSGGAKGVKRTRSLMQRIRAMVSCPS
jgi:hypothetical protein